MKNIFKANTRGRAALLFLSFATLLLTGCAGRHAVVAITGTVIGVEISQNPQTQMYQAKLGYNRGELAIVPSNRSAEKDPGNFGNGASDTTDVLMELKYKSIFSFSNAGIYQRLAVGKTAVSQPGAAFMFAKDDGGELDESKARAIAEGLKKIPETPEDVSEARVSVAKAYTLLASTKADVFNKAAAKEGYADFRSFLLNRPSTPTLAHVQSIRSELEKDAEVNAKLTEIDAIRQP